MILMLKIAGLWSLAILAIVLALIRWPGRRDDA